MFGVVSRGGRRADSTTRGPAGGPCTYVLPYRESL